MRNFYYLLVKNVFVLSTCAFLILSYQMVYNRFYFEIHEDVSVSMENQREVYPCGKVVGIYTSCDGIFVIDTCEIESQDGSFVNIAKDCVKTGDYIVSVNGKKISEKEELVDAVNDSGGNALQMEIIRNEERMQSTITPVRSKSGAYMLGIWVKDDLAGIGTVTYFTRDGNFAALGHGMGDGETQRLVAIDGGDLYVTNIIGIEKGLRGNPGEIKGVIYYGKTNHLGILEENTGRGIFGTLDAEEVRDYIGEQQSYPVAGMREIKPGKAQIISEISGERKSYEIEITYVDYLASDSNKGLHIEITDPQLLALTGGIVQGMSGSPIIQDGKLVGAVTHVLVNDPTRGYGIFIENMLDAEE